MCEYLCSSLLWFESVSVSVLCVFVHICMVHVFGDDPLSLLKFQVEVK